MCFAGLVTHYWSNGAFVPEDAVLRDAHRLAGIPGAPITGRLDISGPPDVAWQARARSGPTPSSCSVWATPATRTGDPTMEAAILAATASPTAPSEPVRSGYRSHPGDPCPDQERCQRGSWGSPSTRSPRMLRMMFDVPPMIV